MEEIKNEKRIKNFSQSKKIRTLKRKSVKPQKPEIKVFSNKKKYHIIKVSNLS